jgi:hypothetical protein
VASRRPLKRASSDPWRLADRRAGVDPDIVVDNLPHATYAGGDAQLDSGQVFRRDQKNPIQPRSRRVSDKSFNPRGTRNAVRGADERDQHP